MNAAALIAAARGAGAELRLNAAGDLQARGRDLIPPAVVDSMAAQHRSVISALEAESFAASSLPWRPHGPHHLAHLADGTRLLAMRCPDGRSWALTRRDCPDCKLIVVVAKGCIHDVLTAATREAPAYARSAP